MIRIAAAAAIVLALASAALAAVTVRELPTGWRILVDDTATAPVGTLPTGLVVSRDGALLSVLETGHLTPQLRVLDAGTLKEQRRIALPAAFGAPLPDAAGDGMWIANTAGFGDQIAHVEPRTGAVDATVSLPVPFFAAAVARSPDGALLAVSGDLANRVALVDARRHAVVATVDVGRHPGAVAFSADGRTVYVADRAQRTVDAVDVARRRVRARITVGLHPSALLLRGDRLFVADADDDDVSVVDLRTERVVQRAPLPFDGPVGSSPNALALDGDRLYVSCGAADAVVVYRIADGRLSALGAIPVGWYPTAVTVDPAHRTLFVADGKGEGGKPNPGFDSLKNGPQDEYIADLFVGAVRRLPIPTDAALRAGLARVRSLRGETRATPPPDTIVRAGGPIKHVIYIVKENRTYDQVLGDETSGDGDPKLVLYGRRVTPNQHALVERFGLFDRFFCDAEVSADGHNWSMAAFSNDYLQKMWPPQYGRRRPFYDFEDGAEPSVPHNGYLFDDVVRHGLTLRNYGLWSTNGPRDGTPVSTSFPALAGRTDPAFAGFDLRIHDVARFTEWKREFDAYERSGTLPSIELVRFANDHTAGTRSGDWTPEALVADNDRAVGLLVEAVSHSKDWASTAIFILEDDAQNGADHVDAQRSTLYVVSPYAASGVAHEHLTTAGVLRTMELLLGLPPMSAYDAAARPLYAAFGTTPNLAPFDALPPQVDLEARNGRNAAGAAVSAAFDLAEPDAVEPGKMNAVLWRAAKGEAPR